jgi:hypothetical protein
MLTSGNSWAMLGFWTLGRDCLTCQAAVGRELADLPSLQPSGQRPAPPPWPWRSLGADVPISIHARIARLSGAYSTSTARWASQCEAPSEDTETCALGFDLSDDGAQVRDAACADVSDYWDTRWHRRHCGIHATVIIFFATFHSLSPDQSLSRQSHNSILRSGEAVSKSVKTDKLSVYQPVAAGGQCGRISTIGGSCHRDSFFQQRLHDGGLR